METQVIDLKIIYKLHDEHGVVIKNSDKTYKEIFRSPFYYIGKYEIPWTKFCGLMKKHHKLFLVKLYESCEEMIKIFKNFMNGQLINLLVINSTIYTIEVKKSKGIPSNMLDFYYIKNMIDKHKTGNNVRYERIRTEGKYEVIYHIFYIKYIDIERKNNKTSLVKSSSLPKFDSDPSKQPVKRVNTDPQIYITDDLKKMYWLEDSPKDRFPELFQ